jgi:hypothetical protein
MPRAAHAMTIRLLPVKSSAPPTTTSTRPRLKTTPASTRMDPEGESPAPARATVKKTAPSAMKAPARTLRTESAERSKAAFRAPASSARSAI